eukprot:COSAG06_NODE_449_length_15623_cov_50.097204_12_plen_97_part_00
MIVFIYKWRKKWRFPHISAPLITVTAATPASPLWMTGNSVSIYWLQCGKRETFSQDRLGIKRFRGEAEIWGVFPTCEKRVHSFLGGFPMFVPSLSW